MSNKKSKKANPANKAYLSEQRWLKNKAKKLVVHAKKHPNDLQKVGTVPSYTRVKPEGYQFGQKSTRRIR